MSSENPNVEVVDSEHVNEYDEQEEGEDKTAPEHTEEEEAHDDDENHDESPEKKREPTPKRNKADVGQLRRRSSVSKFDVPNPNSTTFEYLKNLFYAIIRFLIFWSTGVILTTLIGNYTYIELGCYTDDGYLAYVTRDEYEFNALDNDCFEGNYAPLLLLYHLGNILYVLVALVIMIDAIVPGPWHRPSEGVIFRTLSFKFKTWDSDNVGIGIIRFMFHLLIVCYGNCKILQQGDTLAEDDYFLYFFDILDDYDYVHLVMFISAWASFLFSMEYSCVENNNCQVWWNQPSEELFTTHSEDNFEAMWKGYNHDYALAPDNEKCLCRYCNILYYFKGRLWFFLYTLNCVLCVYFSCFHLIDVYSSDNCNGTDMGKMVFVFLSQVITIAVLLVYLVRVKFWDNQLGGVDGRSWLLMLLMVVFGYNAIEPKYPVDYADASGDAHDVLRMIIGWLSLVTIGIAFTNTVWHKIMWKKDVFTMLWTFFITTPYQMFLHGALVTFSLVCTLSALGQFPVMFKGIVFQLKNNTEGTDKELMFTENKIFLSLIIVPAGVIGVAVLFAFFERTVQFGNVRSVPFFLPQIWLPGFIVFMALTFSSYRTMENITDFYQDLFDVRFGSGVIKLENSNAYDAGLAAHLLLALGLAGLFVFYLLNLVLHRDRVSEELVNVTVRPSQVPILWVIPFGLSFLGFFLCAISVYDDAVFKVGTYKGRIEVPDGLKDLILFGPIMTVLSMFFGLVFSFIRKLSTLFACCQEGRSEMGCCNMVFNLLDFEINPLEPSTIALISMSSMATSFVLTLMHIMTADHILNLESGNLRLWIDGSFDLLAAWLLSAGSIIWVICDDAARPLPLYLTQSKTEMIFQPTDKDYTKKLDEEEAEKADQEEELGLQNTTEEDDDFL